MRSLAPLVACVSLLTAIPAEGSRSLAPVGNFACYRAAFTEFATTKISVRDQFGTRIAIVGRPTDLCAPAAVNGRPIFDSVAHLTCHPIKLALKGSARISVRTQQFGVLTATVVRASELCVPSSTATGGALRPPPKTLDSFVCYSAVPLATFATRIAALSDDFAKTRDAVLRPTGLCLPATVGTSRRLQSQLLACYELKSAAKGSGPVIARSKLGLLQASLGARNQLCAPSTKSPP